MGSLFGGGSGSGGGATNVNNVAGASTYVPTGQSNADVDFQQLFENLAAQPNYPAQNLPQITSNVNALTGSPYAPGAQTAANNEGTILTGLSNQDIAGANALQPFATQTLNTAFDPQNALFNQQSQQLQDQVNATNSMYGLGTSPVGASILDNQLQNFDINWQNSQLARQQAGASTAEGLLSGSANLGGQAATAEGQGGSVPQSAYTGNISNNLNALSGLNTAGVATTAIPTTLANFLQSYLGLGQTANANEINAANSGFSNLASAGSGLAQGAGAINGLGTIFGGGTTTGSGVGASSAALEDQGFGLTADQTAADTAAAASGSGVFSSIGDWITSLFA